MAAHFSYFAQLPAEIKLHVLMFHTLYVRTEEFAREGDSAKIKEAVGSLSHDATSTSDAFHPCVADVIRSHFPFEARILPIEHFREYVYKCFPPMHAFHPNNLGSCFDTQWHERVDFFLHNRLLSLRDDEEVWWLRYLSLVASRVECILRELNKVWYPQFGDQYYYCFVDLWRFLAASADHSRHQRSTLDITKILPQARMKDVLEMVEAIGSCYAQGGYHAVLFPFDHLGEQYRARLLQTSIKWPQFLRCGAFAMCISHYLLQITPEELVNLFCPSYDGADEIDVDGYSFYRAPEKTRRHVTLDIDADGDTIVLGPGMSLQQSHPKELLDRNRYWVMSRKIDGWEDKFDYPKGTDEKTEYGSTRGKWLINRHDIEDDEFIDGIHYLARDELEDLFKQPEAEI